MEGVYTPKEVFTQVTDETEESQLAVAIASLHVVSFPHELSRWLQKTVSFDNITILAYFQNQAPSLLLYEGKNSKILDGIAKDYLAGAYLLDPFHDLHINTVPAGVYLLSDVSPDKFRSNPYYLEYYKKTKMMDELAFVTYPASGVSLHVCLGRDDNSNQVFTPRDLENAHRIAPLVSALSINHWNGLRSEGAYAEEETTSKLIREMEHRHGISLSPRQAEVAMLVLRGHSSVSIGLRLGVSFQTIKVFRKQLYKKCHISSQAQLFKLMIPVLEMVSAS